MMSHGVPEGLRPTRLRPEQQRVVGTLPRQLGLGARELVSIVGAGGKSTLLFALGRDLAASGASVILTTTTRVGDDQPAEPICWSADPATVEAALHRRLPLFVAVGRAAAKITGPSAEEVDRLFGRTSADHVIVEADGAAGRLIKAPAEHEPVIPAASTTVVVVASIAAIGHPISAVAHRPERVAALLGTEPGDRLTIEGLAAVLLHPNGGLKRVPAGARVVMAITGVTPATEEAAQALTGVLASCASVERAITLRETPLDGGSGVPIAEA